MTEASVSNLLEEGIRAVKRGDKAHGRDLLLRVVEADERNEQAWLWLSVAVEDPADKLTALENVLAINPNNVAARSNARWWRQKVQTEPPAAEPSQAAPSEPAQAPPAPEAESPATLVSPYADLAAPQEFDDGVDDPYQCPYCGRPAAHTARRCPHCGRSLMMRQPTIAANRAALRAATLATGVLGALGAVELVPLLLVRDNPLAFRAIVSLDTIAVLTGSLSESFYALAPQLLLAGAVKVGLLGLATGGLALSLRPAYFGGLLLATADLIWSVAQLILGWMGPLLFGLNVAAAVWALTQLLASERDFGARTARVLTQPDRGAHGPLDYYRRGHAYRRRGMWALAVLHWRHAVAGDPLRPEYYTDLGIGYAQIGRYARSLRALGEAARQAPNDAHIREMIELVRARQTQDDQAQG